MKKPLLPSLIFFFALTVIAQAENFNLISYYPAPSGNYKSIRLTPRLALDPNPGACKLGTIYSNANDNSLPYYCAMIFAVPTFAPISGLWTLNGNDLYLTDTTSPALKRVSIGTTTPILKLTITNDGGILADGWASTSSTLPVSVSGVGTRLIWYPLKGAFRAGYVTSSEWDDEFIGQNSVAMGYGSRAMANGATVWGGQNNSITGGASPGAAVIAGGRNNTTGSELAQILGGLGNSAGIGRLVFGENNTSSGSYSMIGGGKSNSVAGNYGTISGGLTNTITASTATTISGGSQNTIQANYGTISGGTGNRFDTDALYSTIAGGQNNTIFANSNYSVISGGMSNITFADYSTVSGGDTNTASMPYSTIVGGQSNSILGVGSYQSISGGLSNTASNDCATVLGGSSNTASGDHAIVLGGANNIAAGSYSLTAGRFMNNTGDHNFVWGYSGVAMPATTTNNAMIIYSSSIGIRDTTPAALLEINGNGNVSQTGYLNLTSTSIATAGNILRINSSGFVGVNMGNIPTQPLQFGNGAYVSTDGNFIDSSSRKYKENINDLKISDALTAFSKLTPVQYNYKNEPGHRYLGFIAEDVPELVADQGRHGLSPMDIAAVLTKVVEHQQNILQEQTRETNKLLREVEVLKNKIHVKNQLKPRLQNL